MKNLISALTIVSVLSVAGIQSAVAFPPLPSHETHAVVNVFNKTDQPLALKAVSQSTRECKLTKRVPSTLAPGARVRIDCASENEVQPPEGTVIVTVGTLPAQCVMVDHAPHAGILEQQAINTINCKKHDHTFEVTAIS